MDINKFMRTMKNNKAPGFAAAFPQDWKRRTEDAGRAIAWLHTVGESYKDTFRNKEGSQAADDAAESDRWHSVYSADAESADEGVGDGAAHRRGSSSAGRGPQGNGSVGSTGRPAPEELRQAVLWSEILGEPAYRRRRRRPLRNEENYGS